MSNPSYRFYICYNKLNTCMIFSYVVLLNVLTIDE